MTFDEVLTQVLALLQRQGRVSYRALQRRFHLDDEYLADLKEELLFAYPVVDAEGRGLVWTGHVAGGTATASHPHKRTQQPPTPDDQPTQHVPPPSAPPTPEAERRHLTVMFQQSCSQFQAYTFRYVGWL